MFQTAKSVNATGVLKTVYGWFQRYHGGCKSFENEDSDDFQYKDAREYWISYKKYYQYEAIW